MSVDYTASVNHVAEATAQHNKLTKILADTFGYSTFRVGQEIVIEQALAKKDTLVLMPTGGGKSLCYQIPALAQDGLVLVVSPLISLMQDQVEQCRAVGINAGLVNSALTPEQIQAVFGQMHRHELDILFVAPERLLQLNFMERLQELNIGLIAVDEAHCVSHWGHDFRQDYRMLGKVREHLPYVPIMALTATADLATREDITHQLSLDNAFVHLASFDRPNIQYTVASKYKPLDQIVEFIKQRDGSGIIYCNSRKKVDEIATKLNQRGYRCGAYHAGLTTEERAQAQRDFQVDNLELMVATVAFGMGINKSNVRFVIHHDLPRSIEAYYQETGRAGRDGLPAEALLLFAERDAARIQEWIETGEGARTEVELEKFAAMQKFAEAQTCRRQVLLNYFAQYSDTQCGNCDVCLDPPQHFSALEIAQKVLSCVYRMRQQGTANQVVEVLKGRKPAKIIEFGFDKISTFGIGKNKPDEYWFNIINQLVHQGFLRIDITRYGALSLTEAAKDVLRGTFELQLAVPRLTVVSTRKATSASKNYDKVLFAKLKHLRKQLADQQDIPPFVVFSDASLMDMADQLPQTQYDFLQISGVGQVKLEKYGDDFIAAITAHCMA